MTDIDKKHAAQRDEIKLYFDKSFQSSIGYFAAIFALIALSRTSNALENFDVKSTVSISILLTNWLYFILISSCFFAIQKRVLYILCTGPSLDYYWEIFSDNPLNYSVWKSRTRLSWKLDSYFVVPIFFVIITITVFAVYIGWQSPNTYTRVTIFVLVLLHAIPAWMTYCMIRLGLECGRRVKEILKSSPTQDAASPVK